jgi:hypothetical protein
MEKLNSKTIKILIFFCLFFVFCFFSSNIALAGLYEIYLTVNKTSVYINEEIVANAIIKLYDGYAEAHGTGIFHINFGDGTPDERISCSHDSDSPEPFTKCQHSISHTYTTSGTKVIAITTTVFGGAFGGTWRIAHQIINVLDMPTSTPPLIPESPIEATTTAALIREVADFISWIVGGLLVLMIIIGGYFILTAGGKPEQVTKGKQIIFYAIIGFAVMIISRGILAIIYKILDVDIP